ncbi:MAG: hypothetical protein JWP89_5133 [Schlesneria sp.]|nr:hypothetical protein [Schlesneria sp.]
MADFRAITVLTYLACFAWLSTPARGEDFAETADIAKLHAIVRSVKRDAVIAGSPVVHLELEAVGENKQSFRDEHIRLLQQYPHLRSLGLDCRITDAGITELCELKNLTSLELGNCDITDAGLSKLAALEKLNALRLWMCRQITGETLGSLTQLSELRIRYCPRITALRVAPLQKLTHLGISECDSLTGAGLNELRELPNLAQLKVLGCPFITDSNLDAVKGLHHLRHLTLRFHYEQPDAGLTNITDLRGLESLSLHGKLMPDTGLAELGKLRQLSELHFSGAAVTNDGIKVLGELPELTRVSLNCEKLDGSGLQVLSRLPQLTDLEFEGNFKISDGELKSIKACTSLKKLALLHGGRDVSAEGMATLGELPHLDILALEGHFSIEALREIQKLTSLKVLQIDLSSKMEIGEFKAALPMTEIVWRRSQKHSSGKWRLESFPRNKSQPFPVGYPFPYRRRHFEPL